MPVSEWEEVGIKLGVALFVVPAIFIGISLLGQVLVVLLAMLTVWRMELDPFTLVLANVDFVKLVIDQVGGWLLSALWIAPVYCWLLLASAGARRSPFMLAVAPVIGLVVLERVFIGTSHVTSAIGSHLPHYSEDGTSVALHG